MSQIVHAGNVNLAALSIDDVTIIIIPPGIGTISGSQTDISGIVGTGGWGPIDEVIFVGSPAEATDKVGRVRRYHPGTTNENPHDIATAIAMASLAGARKFRCIRVEDSGGGVAATETIEDVGAGEDLVDLTAKYKGTRGNDLRVLIEDLTATTPPAGVYSFRVTIFMDESNLPKEVYNVTGKVAPDTSFGLNLVDAITNGQGFSRPPSQLVTAAVSTSGANPGEGIPTGAHIGSVLSLTGGDDGSDSVTESDIIGSSSAVTGMYKLEGTEVFQFICMGVTTNSNWSTMASFALANGMMAIAGYPAAQSVQAAIDTKSGASLDTFALMLVKDMIWWDDPVNQVRRLVPPEALALGMTAIQSPEQGVGNKPVFGIAGTEKTQDETTYTRDEIGRLTREGINFFMNPIPYGNVFGLRHSQNASSDLATSGTNYTRVTNFIAKSLANSLGRFINTVQSISPQDQTRANARAVLSAFLTTLKQPIQHGGAGIIDDFNLILDETNNTCESIGQGNLNAFVTIRYLAIIRFFNISMQGGQTVITVSERENGGSQQVLS